MNETFVKNDQEKPDISMIEPEFIEQIALVMMYGAKKYSRDNWKKCDEPKRYYSAVIRHMFAWLRGETIDKESSLPHLAHAGASLMMLMCLPERVGGE